jgi:hypothetical protein
MMAPSPRGHRNNEVIYAAVENQLCRPMLRLVMPDHGHPDFPFPNAVNDYER